VKQADIGGVEWIRFANAAEFYELDDRHRRDRIPLIIHPCSPKLGIFVV